MTGEGEHSRVFPRTVVVDPTWLGAGTAQGERGVPVKRRMRSAVQRICIDVELPQHPFDHHEVLVGGSMRRAGESDLLLAESEFVDDPVLDQG